MAKNFRDPLFCRTLYIIIVNYDDERASCCCYSTQIVAYSLYYTLHPSAFCIVQEIVTQRFMLPIDKSLDLC